MQKDFHYYCIGILARAAGFTGQDALTIAYASQYTDDATESRPITLNNAEGKMLFKFDPVRCAYIGLKAKEWSIHKRVYIPFHFIPPRPFLYTDPTGYLTYPSFVTQPGSPFAKLLLRKAAEEENNKRRLCRIGVALHMFADTWAHQNFSGRASKDENGVEDVELWEESGWEKDLFTDDVIDALIDLFAIETGHAEAGALPDLSFIKWKYKKRSGEQVERDNPQIWLEASRTIYDELIAMQKTDPVEPIPWGEIEGPLKILFDDRGDIGEDISLSEKLKIYLKKNFLEERCSKWQEEFGKHFDPPSSYAYDRKTWRDLALNPRLWDPLYEPESINWEADFEQLGMEEAPGEYDRSEWDEYAQSYDYSLEYGYEEKDIAWDDWSLDEFERKAKYILKPSFPDSLWVHFHRAALRHQSLVLQHLP